MLFFTEMNTLEETHTELCESLSDLHQANESSVIFSESSDFAFLNEDSEGMLQNLSSKLEKAWDAFVQWIKKIFDKVKELGEKLKQKFYKMAGKSALEIKFRSTPEVVNKLASILKSARFTDKAGSDEAVNKLNEFDSYYNGLGDKTKKVNGSYFVNTSAEMVVGQIKPAFSKLETTKKQISSRLKGRGADRSVVDQQRALIAAMNTTRKVINNVYSDYASVGSTYVSKKTELDSGAQYHQ